MKRLLRNLLLAAATAFCCDQEQSFGASFYVDFHDTVPSSAFAGAAPQGGFWNAKTFNSGTISLNNTQGVPTTVTLTHTPVVSDELGQSYPDPGTTGDVERLLDDIFGTLDTEMVFTYAGLDAGIYRVITYARHPNPITAGSNPVITSVTVNDSVPQLVSRTFAAPNFGPSGLGNTFADQYAVVAPGGSLVVKAVGAVGSNNGMAVVNGIQVLFVPEPTTLSSLCAVATLVLVSRRRQN